MTDDPEYLTRREFTEEMSRRNEHYDGALQNMANEINTVLTEVNHKQQQFSNIYLLGIMFAFMMTCLVIWFIAKLVKDIFLLFLVVFR